MHAVSDAGDKSRPPRLSGGGEKAEAGPVEEGKGEEQEEVKTADEAAVTLEEAPLPPDPVVAPVEEGDAKSVEMAVKPQAATWFGWWSRPDGYDTDGEKAVAVPSVAPLEVEASTTPLPGSPLQKPADLKAAAEDVVATEQSTSDTVATAQVDGPQPEMTVNSTYSRSWFGLWSSAQNEQAVAEAQIDNPADKPVETDTKAVEAPEITISAEPEVPATAVKSTETPSTAAEIAKPPDERPKASGWAFWSTDKPASRAPSPGSTQKEVGELAVADTPSQSHPEVAQFNEEQRAEEEQKVQAASKAPSLKRGRGEKAKAKSKVTTPAETSSTTLLDAGISTLAPSQGPTPSISQVPTPVATPPREESNAPQPIQRGTKTTPQTIPNLILPPLTEVYTPIPHQTYTQRLSAYVAASLRLPGSVPPPLPPSQIHLTAHNTKIHRAIAIGIHGFFPAPLLQKVLGQPTGTSIRFAAYAASAIKTFCATHQPNSPPPEIERVALEGEGIIADRVSTLWNLLLNWLSHLRSADFILLAAHSQGVPVTLMLVAKLLQLGCLAPGVRIAVCAMAGINLGPFLDYKSRLFAGSAAELFEFCDSETSVSKAYAEALRTCLSHGVRVTFVGSLDDQLVSLE